LLPVCAVAPGRVKLERPQRRAGRRGRGRTSLGPASGGRSSGARNCASSGRSGLFQVRERWLWWLTTPCTRRPMPSSAGGARRPRGRMDPRAAPRVRGEDPPRQVHPFRRAHVRALAEQGAVDQRWAPPP